MQPLYPGQVMSGCLSAASTAVWIEHVDLNISENVPGVTRQCSAFSRMACRYF